MPFLAPPSHAAYRHCRAREGFEVVFFDVAGNGLRIDGSTAAIEDGVPWTVEYRIELDSAWTTRRAEVAARSGWGRRRVVLEGDGCGRWTVDGAPDRRLDGCLDVDLESSSLTNAFPVHRLELAVGEGSRVPAVYVRAADLRVDRLEQSYRRVADKGDRQRFAYAAPTFGFTACLVYDRHGLLLDYPGIAVRAA